MSVWPMSVRARLDSGKERGGGGGRLRKNGNPNAINTEPQRALLSTRSSLLEVYSHTSQLQLDHHHKYNSRKAQLNHIYHLYTSRYHRTGQDPRAPTRRNKGNTPRQSITKTSHPISHHGRQSKVGRRGHTVERPVLERVERGQEQPDRECRQEVGSSTGRRDSRLVSRVGSSCDHEEAKPYLIICARVSTLFIKFLSMVEQIRETAAGLRESSTALPTLPVKETMVKLEILNELVVILGAVANGKSKGPLLFRW